MGANEKVDAAMHGVGDTAALIAEARRTVELTGVRQSTILIDRLADALEAAQAETATAFADRDAALERLGAVLAERDSLSRLHEEATERTVQLAAVIEHLAQRCEDSIDARYGTINAGWLAGQIAAAAPGDVLREHDAKVLEDAAEDIHLGDDMETLNRHGNRNVIRNAEAEASSWLQARAAALRVGANPTEEGNR